MSKQTIIAAIDSAIDEATAERNLVGTNALVHQLKLARRQFASKNANKP